jgi:hypothetical protein
MKENYFIQNFFRSEFFKYSNFQSELNDISHAYTLAVTSITFFVLLILYNTILRL